MSRRAGDPWHLFHVRGSAASRTPELPDVPDNCQYHRIVLGFILENGRSRWLTHAEIAQGVIEGIRLQRPDHVVGTVEPWDMRPEW